MNKPDLLAERQKFSVAAPTYEQGAKAQAESAERLLNFLPHSGFSRLLEAGCGTGLLTRRLGELYESVEIYAFDFSTSMVARAAAARQTGSFCWFVADARQFSLNKKFPLIVSSTALHWAQPLAAVFSNLAAHLQVEGKFIFNLMTANTLWELQKIRSRVAPDKAPARPLPRINQVRRALAEAGLKVEEEETVEITVDYASASDFLNSLKRRGVTGRTVAAPRLPLTPGELRRLRELYEKKYSHNGGVRATYEVGFYVTKPVMSR